MQITFNPADPAECMIVAQILDGLHPSETVGLRVPTGVAAAVQANPAGALQALQAGAVHPVVTMHANIAPTPLAAAGIGTDATGQDNRDPAAVFGAASAPPLPGAPLGAAAPQFLNAPAVPPAGLPMVPPVAQQPAAPAPAPASAPLAPVAGTTPVPGVETDSTGLPWDQRIHASTKTKNKDGSWKKKPGFNDEAAFNRIVAELRATMAVPTPAAGVQTPLPQTAPQMGAPVMQPAMNGPASSGVPVQQAATLPQSSLPSAGGAAPVMQIIPSAPQSPTNFDELMPLYTAAVQAQKLPEGALEWAISACGLTGTLSLIQRPDFVPTVWNTLKTQYPALAA